MPSTNSAPGASEGVAARPGPPRLPARARESQDGRHLVLTVSAWRVVPLAALGALTALLAVVCVVERVSGGAAAFLAITLMAGWFVLRFARERTVMGPEGIVMRTAFRTRRTPWPGSREDLRVIGLEPHGGPGAPGVPSTPVGEAQAWLMVDAPVSGIPNRRLVPIPLTQVSGWGQGLRVRGGDDAVAVVNENMDAVWAWAAARGYVRPDVVRH